MSNITPVLLLFHQDLRLEDNPALTAALSTGQPVLPIYIFNPENNWPMGDASKWWLHHSLQALSDQLASVQAKLILRQGNPVHILVELAKQTKAKALFFNRAFNAHHSQTEKELISVLENQNVSCHGYTGILLHEPLNLLTKTKGPYKVFTPFWKNFLTTVTIGKPLARPKHWTLPAIWPVSEKLKHLNLLPSIDRTKELNTTWQPGTTGAHLQLKRFLKSGLKTYKTDRDFPAITGTSLLSPHLHFGEITSRTIWIKISQLGQTNSEPFLRQLVWREFAHHTLFHFPQTDHHPLNPKFKRFPWHNNKKHLKAWQHGQTGYPIVDAGMRELLHTGWMHNRVRMIVASFLTKDLLIPWQEGAKWFWKKLVDADLANNSFGWQWVAGCGADAAPYFRIFNPTLQSKKFDSQGNFIQKWIPELSALPDKWIHTPWLAPKDILEKANVVLGKTYPHPIVNHAVMRDEAMRRYREI